MSHIPQRASLVTVDLPDEADARALVRLLDERGYTLVALASDAPGQSARTRWRVSGVDQGPYPDGDEHWWATAERRFLRPRAEELGGRVSGSSADVDTLRLFLHGEILVDRTPDQARDLRLKALAFEPARAPRPVVVHGLGVPPSGAGTGGPIELPGLDDIDWASLTHAYGPAGDTPDILRAMAANDDGWSDAAHEYFSAIVHQGSCYDATARTIPFLVRMALSPRLSAARRLYLLSSLVHVSTLDTSWPGTDSARHEALARDEVIAHVPALLARWPSAPPQERAWLTVLAAHAPEAAPAAGFRDFRRDVEGPSPCLDLALALLEGDEDRACDLTLEAAARDERVPPMLAERTPLRRRHLRVLAHLALSELSPTGDA